MIKADAVAITTHNSLHRTKRFSILPNSTLREIIEASLPEYMAKPEYKGWSEGDVVADVLLKMELSSSKYKAANSKFLTSIGNQPNFEGFGDCTYDEILNMADEGASIPEDVLEWARAMANEDSINYEIDETATSDSTLLTEMQTDMSDEKTAASKANVQKYSIKAEAQNELLNKKNNELDTKNTKLDSNQKTLELEQQKSSAKIEKYNKELEQLEQKVNNGETLTTIEQTRYKALAGKINDENSLIIAKSQNVQAEIESLFDSINDVNNLSNINNEISEQLRLKNETFITQETKSNSGTLPVINTSIECSTNPYLYKALAGDLFSNMTDISQNMQVNANVAKLNVMNANNTALETNQDVTSIENNFTNNNTTFETVEEENPETYNDTESSEITDQTETTMNNTEIQPPKNQDNNLEPDISGEVPETQPIENDTIEEKDMQNANKAKRKTKGSTQKQKNNENSTNTKFNFSSKFAKHSPKITTEKYDSTEQTNPQQAKNIEQDNIEQKSNNTDASQNNTKDVNTKGENAKTTSNTAQTRAAKAIQDKSANNSKTTKHAAKLKQNENKIKSLTKENKTIQAQAKILNNNANQIITATNELTENPENNNINIETQKSENNDKLQKIQSDSNNLDNNLEKNDKNTEKLQKDSAKDSQTTIQTADNEEIVEAADMASMNQNAQFHEVLSEQILNIKDLFTKTKYTGLALMLNPFTQSIGLTMSNIGRYGETISFTANKLVQIAHSILIRTGLNISDVQASLEDMEAQSSASEKGVTQAATQADAANNNAINEFPELENTTTENNEFSPAETPENQENTPTINKQNAAKEDKEPLEITSADVTKEIDISVNDISLDTDDTEIAQENSEGIQQLTTNAINDSKAEYFKNPLIGDNTASASEEISLEVEKEAVDAIAQESTKESAQKSVKESVREVMQSTLSSVNKKAQSKDTDKDKKYKLFTQFEREKQDAMRKAVQKVNRARNAR